MNKVMNILLAATFLLTANSAASSLDKFSTSLGNGISTSGLGANFGYSFGDNRYFISYGCVAYSNSDGEKCGPGLGIERQVQIPKVTVAAMYGPIGTKYTYTLGIGYSTAEIAYGLSTEIKYELVSLKSSSIDLGFGIKLIQEDESKLDSSLGLYWSF